MVLHVLTKKGKGYNAALKSPEKFHGLGPYNAETGRRLRLSPHRAELAGCAWRTDGEVCERDTKMVGVTAAMLSGTGLLLRDQLPGRYFDVGIAEEHAVIFAAGMATMDYRMVVAIC